MTRVPLVDPDSERSIADAALTALSHWGDHPAFAVVSPGGPVMTLSADQLREQVLEADRLLRSWGVEARIPVALFLENSTDFVVLFLALARIGAVSVPCKLDYRHVELHEIFQNSDPYLVISEESHVLVLAPFLRGRSLAIRREDGIRLVAQDSAQRGEADVPPNVASINYTYRGLGYPLGALVTHRQYLLGARVLQDGLCAEAAERMLYSLPMTHIFTLVGCILVPLFYGLTGVIARTIHPRLLFDAIRDLDVQHLTAVPELYALIRRSHSENVSLPSLRVFVCGGSVLEVDAWHDLSSHFGVEVLHGYGLTEFTPVSRNCRRSGSAGTIGPICDGLDVRIGAADSSGYGEIMLRSPALSPGYYRRSRETDACLHEGWFRTGDLGRWAQSSRGEPAGHLIFGHERKPTRKVNGVMVDLLEVQRVIQNHPDVGEVSVVHQHGALSADIVLRSAADCDTFGRDLRAFLKDQIAAYKIPRSINVAS